MQTGRRLLGRLVELGAVSLRRLGGHRAHEVAFGRFLRSRRVSLAETLAAARLAPQAEGRHALALMDATELNHRTQTRRKGGLGTAGNGSGRGVFLHPTLAVDADTPSAWAAISPSTAASPNSPPSVKDGGSPEMCA